MMRFTIIFLLGTFVFSYAQSNQDCMMCHSDPDLTGLTQNGTEISMFVDLKPYNASSHSGLSCVDCHQG
jgi:hypothetical protein